MHGDTDSDYTRRDFIKAGAALSLSGIVGGCAAPDGNPAPGSAVADTILSNGNIATQNERRSMVQALAIKDGRVLATGDTATVMAYRGAATRVVELNGRTVIPGLIDSYSSPRIATIARCGSLFDGWGSAAGFSGCSCAAF